MKNMKKVALLLVFTLAFAMFATACGGAEPEGIAVEGDTIKIGVFEPTTGENGGGGMQEVLGARYANEENPTVTIDGKEYKIELVEVDNQSDKTAAVTAAQNLISDGVVGVIGSYGSGVAIAAGDTFKSAGVPAVGCSCTNPQVTSGNEFYFRCCYIDPFQGTILANYAYDQGLKKAAVISQNGDDYSTGLAGFFKSAYEAKGGEIVADETYQTNETDFNAILTNVKSSGAEVVFIPSSITTASLILPQIKANGIDAQILAADTWENATLITKDAVGVKLSTFFDENNDSSKVAANFVKNFKKYLNADAKRIKWNSGSDTVAAVSALGYDSYMAIYEALKSLDGKGLETITSIDVKDALKTVNFEGVTGNIQFDEIGDAIKDVAVIKTISQKSLETKEFEFVMTQKVEQQ